MIRGVRRVHVFYESAERELATSVIAAMMALGVDVLDEADASQSNARNIAPTNCLVVFLSEGSVSEGMGLTWLLEASTNQVLCIKVILTPVDWRNASWLLKSLNQVLFVDPIVTFANVQEIARRIQGNAQAMRLGGRKRGCPGGRL
jgi:hypothetical protein